MTSAQLPHDFIASYRPDFHVDSILGIPKADWRPTLVALYEETRSAQHLAGVMNDGLPYLQMAALCQAYRDRFAAGNPTGIVRFRLPGQQATDKVSKEELAWVEVHNVAVTTAQRLAPLALPVAQIDADAYKARAKSLRRAAIDGNTDYVFDVGGPYHNKALVRSITKAAGLDGGWHKATQFMLDESELVQAPALSAATIVAGYAFFVHGLQLHPELLAPAEVSSADGSETVNPHELLEKLVDPSQPLHTAWEANVRRDAMAETFKRMATYFGTPPFDGAGEKTTPFAVIRPEDATREPVKAAPWPTALGGRIRHRSMSGRGDNGRSIGRSLR